MGSIPTSPSERGRHNVIVVRVFGARHAVALAAPALVFGYLLAGQVSTQSARSELTVRYNTPLIEAAGALRREQTDLKGQLADLRGRLDEVQRAAAVQSGTLGELSSQIDDLKARAGLTAVVGEGVSVVLDDAKSPATTRQQDLEKSICHSTDITDIVNAGWKGGAEAIAINDERMVGTSSVYCVGSTIMVNGTLMSPPFSVLMIGPQASLMRVFDDPSELRDIKQRNEIHGLGFRVTRQREVRVTGFTGSLAARYATPR